MDNMVKVYEEVINKFYENPDDCEIWLNQMLDDEVIPYKNKIVQTNGLSVIFGSDFLLEVYVNESDVNRVRGIIEDYKNAEILNEYEELNVLPEDLGYDE